MNICLLDFYIIFSKKYAFFSIFWFKFLLKTCYQMTAKSVLMCPQGLRPERVPLLALSIRH